MTVPPSPYAGREQAYVKHFLLRNYLSDLIHKIASGYPEIVYIDGYSGPWQSADDNLGDTSFGIALAALQSAKATWEQKGRNVRMRAMLIEKRVDAFKELAKIPAKYPGIDIQLYNGDFVSLVPTLLRELPQNALAFIFIDPKGWGINTDVIAPLLRRPNTEILFNFMFDFINRAASMADPAVVHGLNALIGTEGWRDRLASAQPRAGRSLADVRKEILIEAFSQRLANIGGYEFVLETPIFRPLAHRTLYSLIYATRKPPGVEVFRRAQRKTLLEQEVVRGNLRQSKDSGAQTEAFLPSQMTGSETKSYLASERMAAERTLLELVTGALPTKIYGDVWPKVLAKHAVTKTELNRIAFDLKKDGRLIFPDWGAGKRKPEDGERLHSPI